MQETISLKFIIDLIVVIDYYNRKMIILEFIKVN